MHVFVNPVTYNNTNHIDEIVIATVNVAIAYKLNW